MPEIARVYLYRVPAKVVIYLSDSDMELAFPSIGLHLSVDLTHFVLVFFTLCMGLVGSVLGSPLEASMPRAFGQIFRYGKTGSDNSGKRTTLATKCVLSLLLLLLMRPCKHQWCY